MEIKYSKSVFRLLERDCVIKRGLNLSKEVLWVSVGQRVAEKKDFAAWPSSDPAGPGQVEQQVFFKPLTLMAGSSAAL